MNAERRGWEFVTSSARNLSASRHEGSGPTVSPGRYPRSSVHPRFVIKPVKRALIRLPACQPPVGAFSSVASLQPTLPMMYRATTNPILHVARASMPAT